MRCYYGRHFLCPVVFNKEIGQRECLHMFSIRAGRGGIGNDFIVLFQQEAFCAPELRILIHCNCPGLKEGS